MPSLDLLDDGQDALWGDARASRGTSACRLCSGSRISLGVNCALGATKVTLAGAAYSGDSVQHDPRFCAELRLHSCPCPQVHLHVHIAQVPPGWRTLPPLPEHLCFLGQPVVTPPSTVDLRVMSLIRQWTFVASALVAFHLFPVVSSRAFSLSSALLRNSAMFPLKPYSLCGLLGEVSSFSFRILPGLELQSAVSQDVVRLHLEGLLASCSATVAWAPASSPWSVNSYPSWPLD